MSMRHFVLAGRERMGNWLMGWLAFGCEPNWDSGGALAWKLILQTF